MKTYKAQLIEIKKSEVTLTEDEIMEHILEIKYFREDHIFRLYFSAASYNKPSDSLWGVGDVKLTPDMDYKKMSEEDVWAYVRANLPDYLPHAEIVRTTEV